LDTLIVGFNTAVAGTTVLLSQDQPHAWWLYRDRAVRYFGRFFYLGRFFNGAHRKGFGAAWCANSDHPGEHLPGRASSFERAQC